MAEPASGAKRSPLHAVTLGTRKGINNLSVLISSLSFSVALCAAAYYEKITWKEAIFFCAIALSVFGGHSAVTNLGIAMEDSAKKSGDKS